MDPVTALMRLGGIARTPTLARLGVTRHALRRSLAAGRIHRPRHGWLCLPLVNAELRQAVEVGAVLTCVTVARRQGLWTHEIDEPHLAVRANGQLLAPISAHVHWAKPVIPRDPDGLEDPLINALVILATCQPYEHGLAAWEAAIRRELVDVDVLRGLPLPPDARRLLADARNFADEGTETIAFSRLSRLRLGIPLRRQTVIAGRPVDILIGDRLVLQIDGGHHVDAQRLKDNEHDARLRLMGYHVIRIGYWQLMNDWATVQDLILTAIAQGLHRARA